MGYFRNAVKGVVWMASLRGSTRAIAYVKIAILARLLGPEEFGIFGIASLVLALLEILTETGINAYLIQEEGKIKKYLNTAWVVSIIRV
jgi:lipopolysaccharide exporter